MFSAKWLKPLGIVGIFLLALATVEMRSWAGAAGDLTALECAAGYQLNPTFTCEWVSDNGSYAIMKCDRNDVRRLIHTTAHVTPIETGATYQIRHTSGHLGKFVGPQSHAYLDRI